MLRKIKPLEWKDDTITEGYCFCGDFTVCYWAEDVNDFYARLKYIDETRELNAIIRNPTLLGLKAAVEQAFVKWLDTFSEEVGE